MQYNDIDRCKVKCQNCSWTGLWWEKAPCPKCKSTKVYTDLLIVFLDENPMPTPLPVVVDDGPPPPPDIDPDELKEPPVREVETLPIARPKKRRGKRGPRPDA